MTRHRFVQLLQHFLHEKHLRIRILVSLASLLIVGACNESGGTNATETTGAAPSICNGFGIWQDSDYVLPYAVGEMYRVNQGNCSGFGHSDFWSYGYDFEMPIGTVVTAARDGIVDHAQDGARDGDRTRTNLITIQHDDDTVALYSHLTLNGVHVTIGQPVLAGDTIGMSGDTGNTGGLPHLHFSLHPCGSLPGLPGSDNCPSIPANFRNTDANPDGLIAGRTYIAGAF
ncbi:MAG: M23 family metallopeptidase [Gammaproteobacteria bacterium]|nr:M23 family metallopeptidase [Gammaproteobacteria bacterium]